MSGAPESPAAPRVAASAWYAENLAGLCEPLDAALAAAHPRWACALARAVPPVRGMLLHGLGRRRRGLAVIYREPGVATLLVLEALLGRGRRRVVLLELIPRYTSRLGPLYRLWKRLVLWPALRRAVAAAHVLSEHERRRYATEVGLAPERLHRVRWPLSSGEEPADTAERRGVLASGRAWSDWETLFAAAAGRGWELTVVCSQRELRRVRALNVRGEATVLAEIPHAEHARLLREAAVFALALRPEAPSAGQVRLLEATDAGTPIVATRIPTLAEYVSEETALLTEPGRPAELRAAVERLRDDPELRARLAARRRAESSAWTYREYFAAIRALLGSALGDGSRD